MTTKNLDNLSFSKRNERIQSLVEELGGALGEVVGDAIIEHALGHAMRRARELGASGIPLSVEDFAGLKAPAGAPKGHAVGHPAPAPEPEPEQADPWRPATSIVSDVLAEVERDKAAAAAAVTDPPPAPAPAPGTDHIEPLSAPDRLELAKGQAAARAEQASTKRKLEAQRKEAHLEKHAKLMALLDVAAIKRARMNSGIFGLRKTSDVSRYVALTEALEAEVAAMEAAAAEPEEPEPEPEPEEQEPKEQEEIFHPSLLGSEKELVRMLRQLDLDQQKAVTSESGCVWDKAFAHPLFEGVQQDLLDELYTNVSIAVETASELGE